MIADDIPEKKVKIELVGLPHLVKVTPCRLYIHHKDSLSNGQAFVT